MAYLGNTISDSGFYGKLFEMAIHKALKRANCSVKSAGKVDERIDRKNYEIKSGAGTLGEAGDKLLKGVSMVIYAPVIDASVVCGDEVNLSKVEGFILTRDNFLSCLEDAGLLREKTATNGTRKVTIQTFYNQATGKPHGKKMFDLIDLLYERCEQTLEEWASERV